MQGGQTDGEDEERSLEEEQTPLLRGKNNKAFRLRSLNFLGTLVICAVVLSVGAAVLSTLEQVRLTSLQDEVAQLRGQVEELKSMTNRTAVQLQDVYPMLAPLKELIQDVRMLKFALDRTALQRP